MVLSMRAAERDPISLAKEEAAHLASALPPLTAARRRTAATMHGPHGRRRPGSGENFWEFRRLQPGDPATSIDWRRSARSERLYVREREWEAAQTTWIWRDGSASMDWCSDENLPTKKHRATVLSIALATLLSEGGERIGALGSGHGPAAGLSGIERFTAALAAEDLTENAAARPPSLEGLRGDATVVLISDFLDAIEPIETFVHACRDQGIGGCALWVLDPAEADFPYRGRIRFEGLEERGVNALLGKAESVATDYRAALAERGGRLQHTLTEAGWTWVPHRTDKPARKALLAAHRAVAERGRFIR
jgi:uncharacterized protein (DUF58 family)